MIGILFLLPTFVMAGEMGTILKVDSLRLEPYADAKTIGNLNKDESVEILDKKGAWLQVKANNASGWVRILSVKRGSTSNKSNNSGIFDVANGRAGTGKVVSTTGIRGLSAEELKSAKFNDEEIKAMESNTVSSTEALRFANAGGLTKTNLAYLKGAK